MPLLKIGRSSSTMLLRRDLREQEQQGLALGTQLQLAARWWRHTSTQRTVRSGRILMHRTRLTPTKHIKLQTMLRELRHEREAIKLLRWELSLRNWPNFSRIKFSWRNKPKRLNASWRGLMTSTYSKHLNYSTKTKKATSNPLNFCMHWSTSPRSNPTES